MEKKEKKTLKQKWDGLSKEERLGITAVGTLLSVAMIVGMSVYIMEKTKSASRKKALANFHIGVVSTGGLIQDAWIDDEESLKKDIFAYFVDADGYDHFDREEDDARIFTLGHKEIWSYPSDPNLTLV